MKVIVVGAGEVGYHIAARLSAERHAVVVIDKDMAAADHLADHLDVQVIRSSGSSPVTLMEAGIREADILLAVTDSDEVNLVSCLMGHMIAPGIKKLARIRGAEFEPHFKDFRCQAPNIHMVINPEVEVTRTIRRLMDVPGAMDVGYFEGGSVKYIGLRIETGSPMVGTKLQDFAWRFGEDRPLIAAIIRKNHVIVPRGKDRLEALDNVYIVCKTGDLDRNLRCFGMGVQPVERVWIVGGGRIGLRLAMMLEKERVRVDIVEQDRGRCRKLSQALKRSTVLLGDGSDRRVYADGGAGQRDVIVTVTDDDETNILVSLLAKNLGIGNAITRIGHTAYLPILAGIGIEKVVSPRLSAVSSILQAVRSGNVLSDISILGEKAEFIEAVALEGSRILNKPLKRLAFPKGALLVCIIRRDTIIIPTGDSWIAPHDKLILFSVKQAIGRLEHFLQ